MCVCWHVLVFAGYVISPLKNRSYSIGAITKDGAEKGKFDIFTSSLLFPHLSGVFRKKISSQVWWMLWGLRLKWVLLGECDLTLSGDVLIFGLFDSFYLNSFTITPENNTLGINSLTHTHTFYFPHHHSHPPCLSLPWEQEQWLLADINNWETWCTHPVYYWLSYICKEYNVVSVRAKSFFFSLFSDPMKSSERKCWSQDRWVLPLLSVPVQETADTQWQKHGWIDGDAFKSWGMFVIHTYLTKTWTLKT